MLLVDMKLIGQRNTKRRYMRGDKMKLKKAWVAGSNQVFNYSGGAESGLSICLRSGDVLLLPKSKIIKICRRFSRFNPLLDDTNGSVFCPTARFEQWIHGKSSLFFGQQLENDDAMRILGALYNEGLFDKYFLYPGIRREDCAQEFDLVAALTECKGRICIFREKGFIIRANLIKVTEEDDGVWLKLKPIPTPGFSSAGKSKLEVGMNFDYIRADLGFVQTSLVSWSLVTHPAMNEHLSDFAASHPDMRSFIQELYAVMKARHCGSNG